MTTEAERPNDSAAREMAPGTLLASGRYRIERLLGSGGMGAVYLAEHVLMRKAVALKVLHREMTGYAEVVARFEREAVAAARIDHPNVATAMDFGRLDDGSCYLVLEYVNGQSLRALLAEGPLSLERALSVGHQITEAMVAAHAAGVVHRDLKPDNVMLVPQPDGREVVKVLDFGIAKVDALAVPDNPEASGRTLTRVGAVMGTAGYMAPEQALGQKVDHRTDLYAFGVMLYEMLSTRLPFEAEEPAQILAKQLTMVPAPLPEEVPAELGALVAKLLDKTADARIQTATELLSELDRLRGGAPSARIAVVAPGGMGAVESARTAIAVPPSTKTVGTFASTPLSGIPRRKSAVAAIGVAALALLGVVVAWGGRAPAEPAAGAPSVSVAAATTPGAAPSPEPEAPAKPSATAAAEPEAPEAPSAHPAPAAGGDGETRTVSETRTSKSSGRTTTRTTRRTTRTETRTKRRTGPGGIYIPPPSQWFK